MTFIDSARNAETDGLVPRRTSVGPALYLAPACATYKIGSRPRYALIATAFPA
jgi:hypothetical protein